VLTRPTILIGPARPDSLEALARVLREWWRVEHSSDRATFARDLRNANARQVVLCDVDGNGVPNAPLLQHCIRRRKIDQVVLVHEMPVVRLSSWANAGLVVGHVMLGGDSFAAASVRVAELLRRYIV
jgi:hypothetical protein